MLKGGSRVTSVFPVVLARLVMKGGGGSSRALPAPSRGVAAAGVQASPPSLCTEPERGVTSEALGARELEHYGQSHTARPLCGGHTLPYLRAIASCSVPHGRKA